MENSESLNDILDDVLKYDDWIVLDEDHSEQKNKELSLPPGSDLRVDRRNEKSDGNKSPIDHHRKVDKFNSHGHKIQCSYNVSTNCTKEIRDFSECSNKNFRSDGNYKSDKKDRNDKNARSDNELRSDKRYRSDNCRIDKDRSDKKSRSDKIDRNDRKERSDNEPRSDKRDRSGKDRSMTREISGINELNFSKEISDDREQLKCRESRNENETGKSFKIKIYESIGENSLIKKVKDHSNDGNGDCNTNEIINDHDEERRSVNNKKWSVYKNERNCHQKERNDQNRERNDHNQKEGIHNKKQNDQNKETKTDKVRNDQYFEGTNRNMEIDNQTEDISHENKEGSNHVKERREQNQCRRNSKSDRNHENVRIQNNDKVIKERYYRQCVSIGAYAYGENCSYDETLKRKELLNKLELALINNLNEFAASHLQNSDFSNQVRYILYFILNSIFSVMNILLLISSI